MKTKSTIIDSAVKLNLIKLNIKCRDIMQR